MKKLFFLRPYILCLVPAFAHEVRPIYLEIKQNNPSTYSFKLKVPAKGNFRMNIEVVLPKFCDTAQNFTRQSLNDAFVDTWNIHCNQSMEGKAILINGLQSSITDALVRIELLDGSAQTALLNSNNPQLTILKKPSLPQVIKTYFNLGVKHILFGFDHLLFILGLLLIVKGNWRILKTITAFTVAHSITLALAALGVVHIPVPPVEALISLSIAFVAYKAVKIKSNNLTDTQPWLVAFIFGLLHGLGFAGALSETGLPQGSIASALLFFNIGVEAGQLIFITTVLILLFALHRVFLRLPQWSHKIPPYAIGSLAMFWTIERVVSFF